MTDLRYPIGPAPRVTTLDPRAREEAMHALAGTPDALRAAVDGLSGAQLDTPYRPEGWTVRQIVHHLPDSHMHAYVRTKLALTEDVPTIKPYDEARWAELPEARTGPVETSLTLLECLHERWLAVLRPLEPSAFARLFRHPEHESLVTLDGVLATYAWHGRHHVAHITALRAREGWQA